MESIQLIQISLEELDRRMEAAAIRAIHAVDKHQATDEQLSTADAMTFCNYRTSEYFRKFCKDYGIAPVATRARVKYYLKSDLLQARPAQQIRRRK